MGKYLAHQVLLGSNLVLTNLHLYAQDSSDELSELLEFSVIPSPSKLTESSSGEEQSSDKIDTRPCKKVLKGKDMDQIWNPPHKKGGLEYPNTHMVHYMIQFVSASIIAWLEPNKQLTISLTCHQKQSIHQYL